MKNTCLKDDRLGVATLVLVMVVMVVSLGVGTALSYKSSQDIRQSGRTSQSDQAEYCAQSGAEAGIKYVVDNEPDFPVSNPPGSSSGLNNLDNSAIICNYSYEVENPVVNTNGVFLYTMDTVIPQDDVFQANLDGYTGSFSIVWGDSNNAAIELTLIMGSSAPYSIEKYAYSCEGTPPDGFDSGGSSGYTGYKCETDTFNFSSSSAQIARVRPLFEDTKIMAVFSDNPPKQGYKIVSTGTSADILKTVEVTVSLPQMSSIFDYVLFSEGGITK